MALKKSDDHHWDFLEEIEAPMWVDLTIESNAFNKDSNDKWFLLSHPFHQCSANQLKFAFSHSKEGIGNSDFDLHESSSPNLPSSVSSSRGKHYQSRKLGIENRSLLPNKGHPIEILGRKTLKAGSGSVQEVKPKSSCNISKGYSSSTASKDPEINSSVSTITNNSKAISCRDDLRRSLHSAAIKVGESNSTSGLLSIMRITLRKSCVTRQASRVEIKDGSNVNLQKSSSSKSSVGSSSNLGYDAMNKDGRIVNSRKSSSSKSSVGSSSNLGYDAMNKDGRNVNSQKSSSSKSSVGSSSNLGYDVMNKDGRNVNSRKSSSSKSSIGSSSNLGYDVMNKEITRRERVDRTPDSRNVAGIFQTANNRETSNISRPFNAQLSSRTSYCTNPKGDKTVIAKTARQDAVKSKLICQPTNRKALVPHRVNEQGPPTAVTKARDKFQVSRMNRRVAGEKENSLVKKAGGQECGGRNIAAEGMIATGQRMKQSELRKVGRAGLVGSKGKASDQIEGKSSRKVIQKVHLR